MPKLQARSGQAVMAVMIYQSFMAIPVLAVIPLLAASR